jgi:hypothetical protein
MVPITLASRSSRRVAGLLMAAGAVLGPTSGAYADGRTANGAPHGPAGSPPAVAGAAAPVTQVAALVAVRAAAHDSPAAWPSRSGGPSPSESASRTQGASVGPSRDNSPLAGRQAGEGRTRPGRSLSPLELTRSEAALEKEEPVRDAGPVTDTDIDTDSDTGEVPAVTSPPSASPQPGRTGRQALDRPSAHEVQQVQQVSLGTGIALIGLGLGFLGFRMRRTN